MVSQPSLSKQAAVMLCVLLSACDCLLVKTHATTRLLGCTPAPFNPVARGLRPRRIKRFTGGRSGRVYVYKDYVINMLIYIGLSGSVDPSIQTREL